jgi:hypothetical protein
VLTLPVKLMLKWSHNNVVSTVNMA